ncbi:MAG: lysophospholipid acyltransferase family protein [Planctomycetota bacterium]
MSDSGSKDSKSSSGQKVRVPAKWFIDGFHRFLRRYLRRHFHCIAVDRASRPVSETGGERPLILFANHPSWWDPLIAQYLNRTLFDNRTFYAPIDAEALEQYKVFERLGFFGVRLSSKSGAAAFLANSRDVLDRPSAALWITPEGQFSDVRDHTTPLMPGLAHLCHRSDDADVMAVALEYAFWDERLPICFASLSRPVTLSNHANWAKSDWSEFLSSQLRDAQRRLSELVVARSPEPFDDLLTGKRGTGWFYDSSRRLKSAFTGKKFRASHGDQF